MGLLRLYLALCVVCTHAGPIFPWPFHSGIEAVQIFFMISGFYMQFIMGKYPTRKAFYTSRFFRIYVPYWVTLAGVILVSIVYGFAINKWIEFYPFQTQLEKNGDLGVGLTVLTKVTLLGQEWISGLEHDAGQSLTLLFGPRTSGAPLSSYLMIPQAWSMSIELLFYLCVPFLVRLRTSTMIIVALTALALRVFASEVLGWVNVFWLYRFFPFELYCFLLGMLSCRFYKATQLDERLKLELSPKAWLYVVQCGVLMGAFCLTSIFADQIAGLIGKRIGLLLSYLMWPFLIAVFFALSRSNKIDRFIGELSYPVYLVHLIVFYCVLLTAKAINYPLKPSQNGPLTAIIAIAISIVMVKAIIEPLDKYRYRKAQVGIPKAGKSLTL